ncbi:hypothetical protein CBL31_26860, partial [Shigella flexneri]
GRSGYLGGMIQANLGKKIRKAETRVWEKAEREGDGHFLFTVSGGTLWVSWRDDTGEPGKENQESRNESLGES